MTIFNLLEDLFKEISDNASDITIALVKRKKLREIAFRNYILLEQLNKTANESNEKEVKDNKADQRSIKKLLINSKIGDNELCLAKGSAQTLLKDGRIGVVWENEIMLNHVPYKEYESKIVSRLLKIADWGSSSIKRTAWFVSKSYLNENAEKQASEQKTTLRQKDREIYEYVWGDDK